MAKHLRSVGRDLQSMVIESPKWVHRRIQVIDSTQAGRLRLENSLDLTPPSHTRIDGSKGMAIIPIAVIPKQVLSAWWITDATGKPLSVISRRQSSPLVRQMLISTLARVGIDGANELSGSEEFFNFVDNSEALAPRSPQTLFDRYPALSRKKAEYEVVRDFVNLLSTCWVVLVEIPEELLDRRSIIKYGYDLMPRQKKVSLWGDNASFSIDIDDPGFSQSLHHEVHVAPELVTLQSSLEHQVARGGKTRIIAKHEQPGTIAHIQNVKYIPRFGTAALEFQCLPQHGGIRVFTGWALGLTGVLLILSMVMWFGPLDFFFLPHWRASTSATVILTVPALLFSWLARTPEAPLVALALLRLRIINLLLALTFLAMASALSILWSPLWWKTIWVTSYVAYACALTLWIVEKFRSRPKSYGVSPTTGESKSKSVS